MGLFGPPRAELEQTAREMAKHSVKSGSLDNAGVYEAMQMGMQFVRFKRTGRFKTASLCKRYKLNLVDLGIRKDEADRLKRRLVITMQRHAKGRE